MRKFHNLTSINVTAFAIFGQQRPQNARKRGNCAQEDQSGAQVEARLAPQRGQRREGRAQGQNLLLLALERAARGGQEAAEIDRQTKLYLTRLLQDP